VISSVLNYVDWEVVLRHVIDNMTDGGLLLINQSNGSDKEMLHGRRPPNGNQILEHLMVKYSGRIEILPNTRLLLLSFDGVRTGIVLAVRIHQTSQTSLHGIDLYDAGLGMYADFSGKPFELKHPEHISPEKFQRYNEYWLSE